MALLKENLKVQVKLQPEPDNRYDSKAIAFLCKIDESGWVRIGYVVREVLDEVHEAINKKKILNVSFDWIKYTVHFKSPGWYAGIRIRPVSIMLKNLLIMLSGIFQKSSLLCSSISPLCSSISPLCLKLCKHILATV